MALAAYDAFSRCGLRHVHRLSDCMPVLKAILRTAVGRGEQRELDATAGGRRAGGRLLKVVYSSILF